MSTRWVETRSCAVAERPRDRVSVSVVSFNIIISRVQSFIISYFGFWFNNVLFVCLFWRIIVCMAHHRRTCLTGLRPTSETVARRCLRSADTTTLQVPSTRRATLGDRAFLVAAVRAWNSLPLETRACSSLLTFRRPNLTFFVSHTADVAPSTPMVSRHLHWAVQQF